MADERFLFGYLFGRRHATPWKAGPRKRPKMPSTPWRIAAMCCALTGGLIGWLLFGGSGSAPIRIAACAAAGFVIGMNVVELAQAIRKGSPADIEHEFSDVLAWVASLANQVGVDLTEVVDRYRDGCPKCTAIPCEC